MIKKSKFAKFFPCHIYPLAIWYINYNGIVLNVLNHSARVSRQLASYLLKLFRIYIFTRGTKLGQFWLPKLVRGTNFGDQFWQQINFLITGLMKMTIYPLQSRFSTRGSHSHRAYRTVCDQDQNEIKGSTDTSFYTKSSDQAAHRKVRSSIHTL